VTCAPDTLVETGEFTSPLNALLSADAIDEDVLDWL
jgi:hypothetical protein